MDSDIDLLSQIKIASPCAASWDEMRGDDRCRFCQHCQLNVYNLSAMTHRRCQITLPVGAGQLHEVAAVVSTIRFACESPLPSQGRGRGRGPTLCLCV
jgi:hypothetical protein